jgi:hypothetical protein
MVKEKFLEAQKKSYNFIKSYKFIENNAILLANQKKDRV